MKIFIKKYSKLLTIKFRYQYNVHISSSYRVVVVVVSEEVVVVVIGSCENEEELTT